MDDRIRADLVKDRAQRRLICDVCLVKVRAATGDRLDLIDHGSLRIAEIIHNGDGDRMPRLKQLHAGVAADIARTAGNKNLHFENLLID